MKKYIGNFLFAVLLISNSTFAEECMQLNYVSDETPPAECPSGYAVKGIRCSDSNCDEKFLNCCSYMKN